MLYLQLLCYWFIPTISTLAILIFLDKKIFEYKVRDLKFYLNHFKFNENTYKFIYKDTEFGIAVKYQDDVNNCFERIDVTINDELAVIIYTLEHLFTKSRRIDFCTMRHDNEIKKVIKVARKKLKKKYVKESNIHHDEYSYFKKR